MVPFPQVINSHDTSQSGNNHRTIIHRLRIHGHRIWEAIDHAKHHNIRVRRHQRRIRPAIRHPERARLNEPPPRQQMGQDGRRVGHRGQDGEAAEEGAEGGAVADVDAAEGRDRGEGVQRRDEGVAEGRRDAGDVGGEWDGVVAGEGPQHAAGGDVGTGEGEGDVDDVEDEEDGGAGLGAGGLEVDRGEGEGGDVGVDYGVDVGDGVEEDDVVEKGGYEAGA